MKQLFSILFLLIAVTAGAQIRYLTTAPETGVVRGALVVNGALSFAKDTPLIAPANRHLPAWGSIGDSIYRWSPALQHYVLHGTGTGSGTTWGAITGNLANQTDLQNALNNKQNKLLQGSSAQYFKGDLSLGTFSSDVRAVGDAVYAPLNHNHSAANIPDFASIARGLISVTGFGTYDRATGVINITGDGGSGGGLPPVNPPLVYQNGILGIPSYNNTNWDAVYAWYQSNPLAGYVPNSRTITIDGVTFDLSQNRSFTSSKAWGSITGTLSNQTDLQNALNTKQNLLGFPPVRTGTGLTINNITKRIGVDSLVYDIPTGSTTAFDQLVFDPSQYDLYPGTGNAPDTMRFKLGSGGSTDTTSLSNRINQRMRYSDTAAMLAPYALLSELPNTAGKLNISDTTAMLLPYARSFNYYTKAQSDARYLQSFTEVDAVAQAKTITINGQSQTVGSNPSFTIAGTDTTSLSSRINQRVRYSDTAAMLLPYVRQIDLPSTAGKLNISDTASMLVPYARAFNYYTKTQSDSRYLQSFTETDAIALAKTITINGNAQPLTSNPNFTIAAAALDTTSMPTGLATKGRLYKALDSTAANHYTKSQSDSRYVQTETDAIALAKTITVNGDTQPLTDNPTFTISGNGTTDTTSLSNRINARVRYTDTAAMLAPYALESDLPSVAGKVNYTDTAAMLSPYARTINHYTKAQSDSRYIQTETDAIALAKTITINGNTQPLTDNPNFTISGSGTLDTTSMPSGTATKGRLYKVADSLRALVYSRTESDLRYLQSYTETDPVFNAHVSSDITQTDIDNWNNDQTGIASLDTTSTPSGLATKGRLYKALDSFKIVSDGRYLQSFTETDQIFSASPAAGITGTNISNWNIAFGWGNHATAGYLTNFTEADPTVPNHVKAITTQDITNFLTDENTTYTNGWGLGLTGNAFRADSSVLETKANALRRFQLLDNSKLNVSAFLFANLPDAPVIPSIAGLATQAALVDTAAAIRGDLATVAYTNDYNSLLNRPDNAFYVQAGTNTIVTGTGTQANPFVVSATVGITDLDTLNSVPSGLTYVVGTTAGAPTAGQSTFTLPTGASGWEVRLYRGRIKQATIDDGSGVYYSKPFGSPTLSLVGDTWKTGELVQIEFFRSSGAVGTLDISAISNFETSVGNLFNASTGLSYDAPTRTYTNTATFTNEKAQDALETALTFATYDDAANNYSLNDIPQSKVTGLTTALSTLTGNVSTNTTNIANNTTAIAAKQDKTLTINEQTASYTLVLSDAGKLVRQNVATANNVTVPPNSAVAFPVGTQITLSNTGAGQVTVVAGSGVTINSAGSALKLRVQHSAASLIKISTDGWLLTGDITQ